MSRSIFGWDLPPGCTMRDIEEAMGTEQPCEICGVEAGACECPECPICKTVGRLACVKEHGLKLPE